MNFPKHRRSHRSMASCARTWIGLLALAALLGIPAPIASAETIPALIAAPGLLVVEAGTTHALPVAVSAASTVPKTSMLLIHGLPKTTALSAGRVFDSGTWALRFSDLENLRIETPSSAAGRAPLTLSVVTFEGKVLAERSMTLSVVAPGMATAETSRPAPSPPKHHVVTATSQAAPQKAEHTEDVAALMTRGSENLTKGKIQIARLFYHRAAEQGWAPGALALAQTYDPHELARLTVVGRVQPDIELAKSWYVKARQLGAAEAGVKLNRLSSR